MNIKKTIKELKIKNLTDKLINEIENSIENRTTKNIIKLSVLATIVPGGVPIVLGFVVNKIIKKKDYMKKNFD